MAEYGKIFKKLWNNARFRLLSNDAKLLLLYLYSSPHANTIGFFIIAQSYISEDLGWLPERLGKPFMELLESRWINYDYSSRVVLIRNWFKYNKIDNDNQYKKAAAEFSEIPQTILFQQYIEILETLPEGLHKGLLKPLRERFGKGYGNSETESVSESEDNIYPETGGSRFKDPEVLKAEIKKMQEASGVKPKEEIPYLDIVKDFNSVTGRNIQTKNKKGGDPKFFRQIKKLWVDEGMRFEDFQKVHRVKHKEWSGTDMAAHLEPETLYRPGNFEKYLRQAEAPIVKPDESWCYNSKTGEIFAYTAENEPKDMPELITGLASYTEAQEWAKCHKFCYNCKKPREFIDGRCQVCGAAVSQNGDVPDGKTKDCGQGNV